MKFKKFTKSVISESVHPAVADYRKFADISEDEPITESMIDEWALNEAAFKNGVAKYDLKHMILGEDVTIDQAARELEAQVVETDDLTQIDKILDDSLTLAKRMQRKSKKKKSDFPNVLFESPAGFGKTEMIKQWAAKRGVNLVSLPLGTTGVEVFSGIVARDADDPRYATRLGVPDLAVELEKPNSVLFLDEYNRSKTEIRGTILTLIQNHLIWDPDSKGKYKFLPNFLFTVAAINPSGTTYQGAKRMDPAERSRFFRQSLNGDPLEQLKFLRREYKADLEEAEDDAERLEILGRLALAEKLLSDPRFKYDTVKDEEDSEDDNEYQPLNYRSFQLALQRSRGTKEGLLRVWNGLCNYKKKHVIEDILGDYVDVQDEANAAIANDSESPVFRTEMTNREKLRKHFQSQGKTFNA